MTVQLTQLCACAISSKLVLLHIFDYSLQDVDTLPHIHAHNQALNAATLIYKNVNY
jgi:hypothetical protein